MLISRPRMRTPRVARFLIGVVGVAVGGIALFSIDDPLMSTVAMVASLASGELLGMLTEKRLLANIENR
ncbi:MAG: hypothetical protein QOH81_468 [Sphingomonadales bacterium]|nr:hypothetical protein [Sphingomonadales bacterium]